MVVLQYVHLVSLQFVNISIGILYFNKELKDKRKKKEEKEGRNIGRKEEKEKEREREREKGRKKERKKMHIGTASSVLKNNVPQEIGAAVIYFIQTRHIASEGCRICILVHS